MTAIRTPASAGSVCAAATPATDTWTAPSADPRTKLTATNPSNAPRSLAGAASPSDVSGPGAGSASANATVPRQATTPTTATAARGELAAITSASTSGPPRTASSWAMVARLNAADRAGGSTD